MASTAPEGFEYTGEFRPPGLGELYEYGAGLADVSGVPAAGRSRWILRRLKEDAPPEPYADFDWSEYVRPERKPAPEIDPWPPEGWRIVGRRPVKAGEHYVSSNGSKPHVWSDERCEGPFSWLIEPELERPPYAPHFELTDEYRTPEPGEWFLARGGVLEDDESYATNDPVKCTEPYVDASPRWILRLCKGSPVSRPSVPGPFDEW